MAGRPVHWVVASAPDRCLMGPAGLGLEEHESCRALQGGALQGEPVNSIWQSPSGFLLLWGTRPRDRAVGSLVV